MERWKTTDLYLRRCTASLHELCTFLLKLNLFFSSLTLSYKQIIYLWYLAQNISEEYFFSLGEIVQQQNIGEVVFFCLVLPWFIQPLVIQFSSLLGCHPSSDISWPSIWVVCPQLFCLCFYCPMALFPMSVLVIILVPASRKNLT